MPKRETKPLLTVIIPIYNAERYLEECLASVRCQTFRDFHVLLVNDGSTDGSKNIMEQACAEDSRFELIDAPNGGVSKARNIGIDMARSEYITFVDADDCLYPESLERLMEISEATDADVVVSAFDRGYKFRSKRIERVRCRVFDYVEAMRQGLYQKILINSPWGVLIKRSLLGSDRRFREGTRYEDLDAFYRFYEGAKKIAYIGTPLYFYRDNPQSFMNSRSAARLDVLDVTDRMAAFFKEHYPELEAAAQDRRFSAHFNMLMFLRRHRIDNSEARERCLRVVEEGRQRALCDRRVRLKNKLGALLFPLIK